MVRLKQLKAAESEGTSKMSIPKRNQRKPPEMVNRGINIFSRPCLGHNFEVAIDYKRLSAIASSIGDVREDTLLLNRKSSCPEANQAVVISTQRMPRTS